MARTGLHAAHFLLVATKPLRAGGVLIFFHALVSFMCLANLQSAWDFMIILRLPLTRIPHSTDRTMKLWKLDSGDHLMTFNGHQVCPTEPLCCCCSVTYTRASPGHVFEPHLIQQADPSKHRKLSTAAVFSAIMWCLVLAIAFGVPKTILSWCGSRPLANHSVRSKATTML